MPFKYGVKFLDIYDDLHGKVPPALKNTFKLTASLHAYITRGTVMYKIKSPAVKTTVLRCIKFQSCQDWNFFIPKFKNMSLFNKIRSLCKKTQ